LIEASDESNDLFGRARLESVLEEARGLPLRESIDAAVQAAAAWQKGGSFDDDISMLAVQINDE
jgi:serine phosphatase RsbU (regulator of sigma subunit)